MMDDELDQHSEIRDDEPLDLICQRHGLFTFRDSMGELHACIPDDPVQKTWPFKTGKKRVLAWLSEKYFAKHRQIISPTTVSAFLQVLEGRGYQRSEDEVPDEHALVSHVVGEPLLQVVVRFMEASKSSWEGRTATLLTELEAFAGKQNIWIKSPKWPPITRVLTQRLNQYQPVLRQLGIRYERAHKESGSYTTLSWLSGPEGTDGADWRPHQATNSDADTSSMILGRELNSDGADASDGNSVRQAALDLVTDLNNQSKGTKE